MIYTKTSKGLCSPVISLVFAYFLHWTVLGLDIYMSATGARGRINTEKNNVGSFKIEETVISVQLIYDAKVIEIKVLRLPSNFEPAKIYEGLDLLVFSSTDY